MWLRYSQRAKQLSLILTRKSISETMMAKCLHTSGIKKLAIEIYQEENSKDQVEPEPPVYCCGSGCQNCVWLQYADKLLEYYGKNSEKSAEGLKKALKAVEQIEDENLKIFLQMELKMKLK